MNKEIVKELEKIGRDEKIFDDFILSFTVYYNIYILKDQHCIDFYYQIYNLLNSNEENLDDWDLEAMWNDLFFFLENEEIYNDEVIVKLLLYLFFENKKIIRFPKNTKERFRNFDNYFPLFNFYKFTIINHLNNKKQLNNYYF